jgi:hypothetical protein
MNTRSYSLGAQCWHFLALGVLLIDICVLCTSFVNGMGNICPLSESLIMWLMFLFVGRLHMRTLPNPYRLEPSHIPYRTLSCHCTLSSVLTVVKMLVFWVGTPCGLQGCMWKQCFPTKRWYILPNPHGVTTQKTNVDRAAVVLKGHVFSYGNNTTYAVLETQVFVWHRI